MEFETMLTYNKETGKVGQKSSPAIAGIEAGKCRSIGRNTFARWDAKASALVIVVPCDAKPFATKNGKGKRLALAQTDGPWGNYNLGNMGLVDENGHAPSLKVSIDAGPNPNYTDSGDADDLTD